MPWTDAWMILMNNSGKKKLLANTAVAKTDFPPMQLCPCNRRGNGSPAANQKHMLQGISWSTYLASAAVLTAIYYTGVACVFYQKEIKASLQPKAKTAGSAATGATDDTAAFENLESLVHEIDSILEQAGNQATKNQLLPQLKAKLANYGGLRQPAYQAAVFNHIIKRAEEISGVRISAEELAG
jgi:hypothetical protein